MISIDNLTKSFGSFVAVDKLSFNVKPGEVLGFLGPNGAGKSTTMKMITGFLTPDTGRVTLFGEDTQAHPLRTKALVGYLPEGAPSYGDMTPAQFLHFIARVRGYKGQAALQRVNVVVEQLALQGVLHQSIDTLSKGFRRRVGIAQAILHDPKVLILDEPTDGLDPNQKHEVRKLIQNLATDKIVIVSTHILEEVTAVCTRAIIIAHGRLLFDGVPTELEAKSRYHGAMTLVLSRPDDIQQAQQAISELSGVSSVELHEAEHRLTVFPQPGVSLFAGVNELIQARHWEVHELHIERGRLDDVFRTITQGAA